MPTGVSRSRAFPARSSMPIPPAGPRSRRRWTGAAWERRRKTSARPARGADDAGGEARRRPRRTAGDVAAPGGRARVRCQGPYGRCGREKPGRSRQGSRGLAGRLHRDGAAVRQGDLFDPPPQSPADATMAWAVEHLSEREAVFAKTDLLAAALAWKPGSVTIGEAEAAVARLEKDGTLHPCGLPQWGESLTTDKAVGDEKETVALMERGQGAARPVMRNWIAGPLLHNGRLTVGQKEAVKTILSSKDRVVGVQGYAGTGKTTMLARARQLAAKSGYRTIGVAPSASAARTLASEAGIETETLQRFLARNAGIAEGRLTRKGAREMRAAFRRTVLVVDEGSLASTVQARDLLRIAAAIRIPRVVVVGDRKQLDAVDAGKPFAQLQAAGMKTAVMDEILRQKDADLKEAVRASLAGEIGRAFGKLGDRIAEVNPDNLAGAAAARWLKLSPRERENTGLMAPSHALRTEINGHIRERLARDGVIRGPAVEAERLVSHGYTGAEKMVAGNYSPGDVVAFHRDYRSLGVAKGDERRVAGVDHRTGTVMLEGPEGHSVPWRPRQVGAKRGAVEVYRTESMELRAGDRIRWTRNDTGLGLVNSDTAEVAAVRGGRVAFRLGDGRMLELGKKRSATPPSRPCLGLDGACVPGPHRRQRDRGDGGETPKLSTQKSFYVEISRARHSAELVTDDVKMLRETLEAATGERVSALEGIGAAEKTFAEEKARGGEKERERGLDGMLERPARTRDESADKGREPEREKVPEQERSAKLDKSRGSRGSRWRCDATRGQANGGARFPRSVAAGKSIQRSDEFVDLLQLGRNLRSDAAGSVFKNSCEESLAAPVSELPIEVLIHTRFLLRGLEGKSTLGQRRHHLIVVPHSLREPSGEVEADPHPLPRRLNRAQPDRGFALTHCPGFVCERKSGASCHHILHC